MVKFLSQAEAFGVPGIEPRWTHSNKDGVGTAYSISSQVWFTVWNGVVTEVYYPTIDRPQIRDLQALASFRLHWSQDSWQTVQDINSNSTAFEIDFVDIPVLADKLDSIHFTFFWTASGNWEQRNYTVAIE